MASRSRSAAIAREHQPRRRSRAEHTAGDPASRVRAPRAPATADRRAGPHRPDHVARRRRLGLALEHVPVRHERCRALEHRRRQSPQRVERRTGAADPALALRIAGTFHDRVGHELRAVDRAYRPHHAPGVVRGVPVERRVDRRRQDRDHVEPERTPFLLQHFRQSDDAELRRRVGAGVRHRVASEDRRDVHEDAGALLAEIRQHRACAVRVPEQVRLDHATEHVARRRLEAAERRDGGVVDPHVDASEPVDGRARQPRHGLGVRDVGRHVERTAAAVAQVAGRRGERRLAPCREHDGRPARRKRRRGRAADAARRAGDDDDARVAQSCPSCFTSLL